jgi:hypothetical protein
VNDHTTGAQSYPVVMMQADGEFVVVWQSAGQDGNDMGVFLRRFDASGLPIGSDFQVNTFTTGAQRRPRMAADADGDFVVVWQGEGSQDGFGAGIFMKAFDSAGFPATGDLQVNAYTSGAQESPAVGLAPDGRFVIAWQGPNLLVPSTREIWVRRFDASALPLAVETLANTTVGQTLGYPAVGVGSDGFVVAWQAADEAGVPLGGIAARRFALSNGAALGSEFLVNAFTTGTQDQAAVAAHPTGGFLLTWSSVGQDGSGRGVFAREFGPDGAAFDEFRVSSFTIADQAQPALAPHDGGRFLVVWRSDGQDGSLGGIFARKVAAERIFGNGFQ